MSEVLRTTNWSSAPVDRQITPTRRARGEPTPGARLLKALAEGEQGEATPYSRELMNELAEAAHKDMLNKKPMDQRPSGAVLSPAERA